MIKTATAKKLLKKAGVAAEDVFTAENGEMYFVYSEGNQVYEASEVLRELYTSADVYLENDVPNHSGKVAALVIVSGDDEDDDEALIEIVVDEDDDDEEEEEEEEEDDDDEEDDMDYEAFDELEAKASAEMSDDDDLEIDASLDPLSDDEMLHLEAFLDSDMDDDVEFVVEGSVDDDDLNDDDDDVTASVHFRIGDTYSDVDGNTIMVAAIEPEINTVHVIERDADGDEMGRGSSTPDQLLALLNDEKRFKIPMDIEVELKTLEADLRSAGCDSEADGVLEMLNEITAYVPYKPTTVDPDRPSEGVGGPMGRPADFGGTYGSVDVVGILKAYGFACKQSSGTVTAENEDVTLQVSVVPNEGGYKCQSTAKTAAPNTPRGKHPMTKFKEFTLPEELEAFVESLGYKKAKEAAVAFLTNPTQIEVDSAAEIDMALYEANNKPFWNVTIAGMPVAQIHLEDQPHPNEISALFATDDFARSLKDAMVKVGPGDILEHHHARFFAATVHKTELAAGIQEDMEQKYGEKLAAIRTNFRTSFLNVMRVAMAGLNKNFWRDSGNPLKMALYEEMKRMGVREKTSIIESAFDDGLMPLFEAATDRTFKLMDMDPQAYAQIAEHIEEINPAVADIPDDEYRLNVAASEQLAAGNVPLRTGSSLNEDNDFRSRCTRSITTIKRRHRK